MAEAKAKAAGAGAPGKKKKDVGFAFKFKSPMDVADRRPEGEAPPRILVKYRETVRPTLAKEFGYGNVMAIPKIEKIVVNMGLGEATQNAKIVDTGADEVARITGDPVVTAGSPVTVVLRQVDGRDIGLTQTSVELLEGKHNLLVDCRIAETKAVSRHSLDIEVFGGRSYRLRAETGPALRECIGVSLEAGD